jgi:hypothetical protein
LKIDKSIDNLHERIDEIESTAATNDNDNNYGPDKYDDEYYLDIGQEPPRFAYYRQARAEKWEASNHKPSDYDTSITQDEIDFALKRELRKSPKQRYQEEKKDIVLHELYYLQHKDGVDHIKEYGCGHPDIKEFRRGCVPECRFYPEYGRIEDDEVRQTYKELGEYHMRNNTLVDPPLKLNINEMK